MSCLSKNDCFSVHERCNPQCAKKVIVSNSPGLVESGYLNSVINLPKICDPIIVNLLKMRPHYSQSSRENVTPSSGTPLLASCKGIPPPPPPGNVISKIILWLSLFSTCDWSICGPYSHLLTHKNSKAKWSLISSFKFSYLKKMMSKKS